MKALIIFGILCCGAVALYHAEKEQKRILAAAEVHNPEALERAKDRLKSLKTGQLEIKKATMHVEQNEEKIEQKEQDEKPSLIPN